MEKGKMTKKEIIMYIIISVLFVAAIIYAMINRNKGETPITSPNNKYSSSFYGAFDTKTDIIGYAKTEEEFSALVEKLKEKLIHYNDLYDIYNNYTSLNNLRTINKNAGKEAVKVEAEIIDLLKFSKELYKNTNGQTNIALGSVLSIWHDYRNLGIELPEEAKLPGYELLLEASKHTDIEKIIIDEANSTVYLADSQMSLDVGSIGKGYAVQKLAEYARELGVENMLISVGGNICAIGTHEDGSPWRLGITNPDLNSDMAYVEKVDLPAGYCVVTSGDYQRYYYVDGKKYCHIIDPDTLYPAAYFPSVSVITNNSGAADALSTALFCMSPEEGLEYINNFPGVEAMWIMYDGTKQYSKGFEEYLVKDK